MIRCRKRIKLDVKHEHLDIESKEEFMYILHLRDHLGIHCKELTELSLLIYTELLEKKEVVCVGERIYKPFVGTPSSEYLQTLWDTFDDCR